MKKINKREIKSNKVSNYFKKQDIIKRRKKIAFIILLFLVAIAIAIFKAPIFAVKNINIGGNKMIKKEGILDQQLVIGKNIFLLDTNEVRSKILENPYVQTAEVKRNIPDGLSIDITERKMFYKIKLDEKIYVLNNELYIMDILDNDENLALVEIEGVKVDSITVGQRITKSDEFSRVAFELAENLIDKNKESIFSKIDLTDKNDVSIYKNDVEIILGEVNNLEKKYTKAMGILNSNKVSLKEGYIDVSVPDQPVIKDTFKPKVEDEREKVTTEEKIDEVVIPEVEKIPAHEETEIIAE
ncbi:MAG: cell division protein FtsQ/DivIB [Sarcina sp.]